MHLPFANKFSWNKCIFLILLFIFYGQIFYSFVEFLMLSNKVCKLENIDKVSQKRSLYFIGVFEQLQPLWRGAQGCRGRAFGRSSPFRPESLAFNW